MPASKKQIVANKQNAKKSTGPKTDEGMGASSMNAVTHGLRSKHPVINSPHLKEDQHEYNMLICNVYDELDPEGIFEEYLARQIANALWRSNRVLRYELETIHHQLDRFERRLDDTVDHRRYFSMDDDYEPTPEDEVRFREQVTHRLSIPDLDIAGTLSLYEARLGRQITRSFTILTHLQRARKAKAVSEKDHPTQKGDERTQFHLNVETIKDNDTYGDIARPGLDGT